MAYIPSELSDNMINKLAGDIAREWMIGKNAGNKQYFIDEYLEVFYSAREIIQRKEQEKRISSFEPGVLTMDSYAFGDSNNSFGRK